MKPPPRGVRAGIALGANLGDRLASFRRTRDLLAKVNPESPVLSAPVFETAPVDCEPGASAFLNTVVEITWPHPPETLLAELAAIEAALGRPSHRPRNRSRTVDLDLLYCGDHVRHTPTLTLPHPRLATRRFVLAPLAALRPELRLPGQTRTVAELLAGLGEANHDDPAAVRLFAAEW